MGISRFVCFDVETPNRFNSRMSAIGISVIENGKIISEYYSLVNPEQRFDYFNVKLTGISSRMVKNEKTFPEIWEEIRETMESGLLTAEEVPYICTCQIGKRHLPDQGHKLDELCSYYNIALNHHHADSDASACARILQHYLTEGCDIEDNLRSYDLVACRTKPAGRKGRKKT